MRYLMLSISAVAVFAMTLIVSVPAQAGDSLLEGNLAAGRKIFMNGKGDAVPACQSCHGVDGLGSDDMGTPRLADQVFSYELKQLTDFATGKRIDNTMDAMNDIAKALTPMERRDVATFVDSLKSPFPGSDLRAIKAAGDVKVGNRSRGAMIVHYGVDGIISCKSCHGYNGRSAGRIFPMLTAQRYVYLLNQLHNWKNGTVADGRANDPGGMMRAVAKTLSDQDMEDAAAYLTDAVPYTVGNPMAPPRNNLGHL